MSQRTREVQRRLRDLGWPITVDGVKGPRTNGAIRDFKRMYAWRRAEVPKKRRRQLGRAFGRKPNAFMGPRFRACLEFCLNRGGRCAPNFRFNEFRSKGNGWIKGDRYHIISLQILRNRTGKAVPILSAFRDPAHNSRVGGARNSQHIQGLAIDPNTNAITYNEARAINRFSGIGYRVINGVRIFRHGDCRHRGPWNFTGGSPSNPTIWQY